MQRRLRFILILFITLMAVTTQAQEKQVVTVGIFKLAPLCYKDKDGTPKGVFVDLIKKIAMDEGWEVKFVYDSWAEGFKNVRTGKIDLMTNVMHLPAREAFIEYHKESVIGVWGQLYTYGKSSYSNFFDLAGKTVGVMQKDANGENFINMLNKFGIKCNIKRYISFSKIADALVAKKVDAGVFVNIHGYSYIQSHKLKKTQIVFSPNNLKFASAKGKNKEILSTIDSYLTKWKSDENSPYHKIVNRYFGFQKTVDLSAWVWGILAGLLGILGVVLVGSTALFLFNKKLRKEVDQATQDLREHAEVVEKMNEDLSIRNKELDEFTYIASHDLQEPLRKISAFSSLLEMELDGELTEDAQENLNFLTDAAKRMQTLVNDLLALSRSGRREMDNKMISLDRCVDNALEALEFVLDNSNVVIKREKLPEIWGDETIITQLYQNLISNGIKFNQSPSPEITITSEKTDNGLVLGVLDNGIGIQKDYQEQIFAPFKKLHGRSEYGGTGIGLSICRKAVDRHNGKIWVESEKGKGSHFKFTIDNNKRD